MGAGCQAKFAADLSPDVRARLSRIGRLVRYRPGQTLLDAATPGPFIAVLCSGYVRTLQYPADGERRLASIAGPGTLIRDTGGAESGHVLEAVTTVEIFRFAERDFDRISAEEPELLRLVYRQQIAALEALRDQIWRRGVLTVEERICAFLWRASAIMPLQVLPDGGGVLCIDVPRADIAALLGTTQETLSRVLHKLHDTGLIEIRDPTHLAVPDFARLAEKGMCGRTEAGDEAGGHQPHSRAARELTSAGDAPGREPPRARAHYL